MTGSARRRRRGGARRARRAPQPCGGLRCRRRGGTARLQGGPHERRIASRNGAGVVSQGAGRLPQRRTPDRADTETPPAALQDVLRRPIEGTCKAAGPVVRSARRAPQRCSTSLAGGGRSRHLRGRRSVSTRALRAPHLEMWSRIRVLAPSAVWSLRSRSPVGAEGRRAGVGSARSARARGRSRRSPLLDQLSILSV